MYKRQARDQVAGKQSHRLRNMPDHHIQSKEEIARGIAAKDQVKQGLVCVLTSVEPCWSFELGPSRETKKLELTGNPRQCLFL